MEWLYPFRRSPGHNEIWEGRIVESGVADKVEHRLQDKHGVYRWYLTRGVPVRDEQGRLTKWIGTTTDINDLKEAEIPEGANAIVRGD